MQHAPVVDPHPDSEQGSAYGGCYQERCQTVEDGHERQEVEHVFGFEPAQRSLFARSLAAHVLDTHAQVEDQCDRTAGNETEQARWYLHYGPNSRAQTDANGHEHQDRDHSVTRQIVNVTDAAGLAADARQLAVSVIEKIRQDE